MVSVEFQLSKQGRGVVPVDLVGESPEDSFPNAASLGVLNSQVIFIVHTLGTHCEVEVCNVKPKGNGCGAHQDGHYLEPTL